MCNTKAPKVKPVANAPVIQPESIDEAAVTERDRERRRLRNRYGRQSTILAGADQGGGQPPTAPAKTALGA